MSGISKELVLTKDKQRGFFNDENKESINIMELAHELTYRKYLFSHDDFRSFFKNITLVDYIVLQVILENEKTATIYSGRTYLEELSDKLQISIRQTSKVIKGLRDKGLVLWSHDGDGSAGTYVTITDAGKSSFEQQEANVKSVLGSTIESFGIENIIQMLRLMKEFGTVLSTQIEHQKGDEEDA